MNLIDIVLKIKQDAKASLNIDATWIEGSYATGRFDESSGIDVWISTSTNFENAAKDFSIALKKVCDIRNVKELKQYSITPKLAKQAYFIRGKSDDNRIELDVQQSSRNSIFDQSENDTLIIFDKTGVINYGD